MEIYVNVRCLQFAHYYSDGADDAYSCLDFVRYVRGVVDREGIIHQGLLQWFNGVSNHSKASKNIYFLSAHFKSASCTYEKYIISLTRITIILC